MELLVIAVMCMVAHMSSGHGDHHSDGKPLEFSSEIHNKDHIIEHLQRQISTKPKDQMTDEELEFHYFKLHDYDNNNKLDGVEIGKALTHFHDDADANGNDTRSSNNKLKVETEDSLSEYVDKVLKHADLNNDGYMEYHELANARKKRELEEKKKNTK